MKLFRFELSVDYRMLQAHVEPCYSTRTITEDMKQQQMHERRKVHSVLAGKPKGKKPLGRSKGRRRVSMKMILE